MPETKSQMPMWIGVVSLCLMCASGAWALSTGINNDRLKSLNLRTTNQEMTVIEIKDDCSHRDVVLERLTTQMEGFALTLGEVRDDVKQLLALP